MYRHTIWHIIWKHATTTWHWQATRHCCHDTFCVLYLPTDGRLREATVPFLFQIIWITAAYETAAVVKHSAVKNKCVFNASYFLRCKNNKHMDWTACGVSLALSALLKTISKPFPSYYKVSACLLYFFRQWINRKRVSTALCFFFVFMVSLCGSLIVS